jgi:hypothetical protein
MLQTPNLSLQYIDLNEAQREVVHNNAVRGLDALVQLAVLDRDLASPPGSPTDGQRWIVAASPTGAWAGHAKHVAAWQDGAWRFYVPRVGWLVYVVDEGTLLAWSGSAWVDAMAILTTLQNMVLLGIGTTADSTNPLSAKLNNTLWMAKTVAEGGDGHLRYKMSKESAAKTLSLLMQTNYSGRAEIGLAGDDDLHFKVSPDGSVWTDALLIDRTTGATKVNAGFSLTGDLSPAQITADQNDYNPTGLAAASILRLSTDASRNLTGLQGGADGRLVVGMNVGSYDVALVDQSASSSAGNRFAIGGNVAIPAGQSVALLYDATASRWRPLTFVGLAPDGSVARPAYAFANDPDCGLYRLGANNIGVAVNAAKVLDIATTGLGITGNLLLGNGAVINFNSGDVTVTHSSNLLAFAGASTGYTFDAPVAVKATSVGLGGTLDVRGIFVVGSGTAAGDAEIRWRSDATATNAAWNVSVRTDVGGSNDDLKFMRFNGTSFIDIPLQIANSTGYVSLLGGVTIGSPTGGNKGAGTLNASAVYDDNSLLTCYVLEAARDGKVDLGKWDSMVPNRQHPDQHEIIPIEIKKEIDGKLVTERVSRTQLKQAGYTEERNHEPARRFAAARMEEIDPAKFTAKWRATGVLPGFPTPEEWANAPQSIGQTVQTLWELCELQAVHIGNLTDRIAALEGG